MKFLLKDTKGKYLASYPDWNTQVTDDRTEAYIFTDIEFFKENYPLLQIEELYGYSTEFLRET